MCAGEPVAANSREKIWIGLGGLKNLSTRLFEVLKNHNLENQRKSLNEILRELKILSHEVPDAYTKFYASIKNTIAKLQQGIGHRNDMLRRLKYDVVQWRELYRELQEGGSLYGIFESWNADGSVNVLAQGAKYKVHVHPSVDRPSLRRGQEVVLDRGSNVVLAAGFRPSGESVIVKELLEDGRVVVEDNHDDESICEVSDLLISQLKEGDRVRLDARSSFIMEVLPPKDTQDLLLEEIPDISYRDIGGLEEEVGTIRDAVELSYLHPDYFRDMRARPTKGVMLYGPPGCGKTMIAKAVANQLAQELSQKRGEGIKGYFINIKGPEILNMYVGETERQIRVIFKRAKEKATEDVPVIIFFDEMDAIARTRGSGISSDVETTIVPQLLAEIDGVEGMRNIIVIGASNREELIDPALLRPGRLEVKIRIKRPGPKALCEIFAKHLTADIPIHPQYFPNGDTYRIPSRLRTLLPTEWERVERILAPVREAWGLEVRSSGKERITFSQSVRTKIEAEISGTKCDNPELGESMQLCYNNQPEEWEFDGWFLRKDQNLARYMLILKTVETMVIRTPEDQAIGWFSRSGRFVPLDTRFVRVRYEGGDSEMLYQADLISGAMAEGIVNRAKIFSIKRRIREGDSQKGIRMDDMFQAIGEEFRGNEDLPNSAHPDDWARVMGRKGARIVQVTPLRGGSYGVGPRGVERVHTTGQYL